MDTTDSLLLVLNLQIAALIGIVANVDTEIFVGPLLLAPVIYVLGRRLLSIDATDEERNENST